MSQIVTFTHDGRAQPRWLLNNRWASTGAQTPTARPEHTQAAYTLSSSNSGPIINADFSDTEKYVNRFYEITAFIADILDMSSVSNNGDFPVNTIWFLWTISQVSRFSVYCRVEVPKHFSTT